MSHDSDDSDDSADSDEDDDPDEDDEDDEDVLPFLNSKLYLLSTFTVREVHTPLLREGSSSTPEKWNGTFPASNYNSSCISCGGA